MQDTLVPTKLIDISALESKEPKMRRMFILADGERTLAELSKLCGLSYEEGALTALALVQDGAFSTSGELIDVPTAQASASPSVPASVVINAVYNEQVTEILAKHLGPIAAVLVNKKLPLGESLSSSEIESQFRSLVKTIDDQNEQDQCLTALRSVR